MDTSDQERKHVHDLSEEEGQEILDRLDRRVCQTPIDSELRQFADDIDKLWFYFGNNGDRHTYGNHRFIQLLREGDYLPDKFRGMRKSEEDLTDECKRQVDANLIMIDRVLDGADPEEVDPYGEWESGS